MVDIESRLIHKVAAAGAKMEAMHLSYRALWRHVQVRSQASALHSLCLVVHRNGYKKWADALYEQVLRKLLDLQERMPRVVLMHEHGCTIRLSTQGMIDAVMLRATIRTYKKYQHMREVCSHAAKWQGTWTRHLDAMMKEVGIVSPEVWQLCLREWKPAKQKSVCVF